MCIKEPKKEEKEEEETREKQCSGFSEVLSASKISEKPEEAGEGKKPEEGKK